MEIKYRNGKVTYTEAIELSLTLNPANTVHNEVVLALLDKIKEQKEIINSKDFEIKELVKLNADAEDKFFGKDGLKKEGIYNFMDMRSD